MNSNNRQPPNQQQAQQQAEDQIQAQLQQQAQQQNYAWYPREQRMFNPYRGPQIWQHPSQTIPQPGAQRIFNPYGFSTQNFQHPSQINPQYPATNVRYRVPEMSFTNILHHPAQYQMMPPVIYNQIIPYPVQLNDFFGNSAASANLGPASIMNVATTLAQSAASTSTFSTSVTSPLVASVSSLNTDEMNLERPATQEIECPRCGIFILLDDLEAHLVACFSESGAFHGEIILCPVCSWEIKGKAEGIIHIGKCFSKTNSVYNEEILKNDIEECIICMDMMKEGNTIARLPCFCIYHKKCIDTWLETNTKCPLHDINLKKEH